MTAQHEARIDAQFNLADERDRTECPTEGCKRPPHDDLEHFDGQRAWVDAEVVEAKPETRKDRARRLLLEAAVLAVLTAANGKARTAIKAEYEVSDADVASFDGVPLGRVRMDSGATTVRVTDQAAALVWTEVNAPHQVHDEYVVTVTDEGLAWVREHHPEWLVEERVLHEVHPSFLTSLVARAKRDKGRWVTGEGQPDTWTDPVTGEEREGRPPFIEYSTAAPKLNVTVSPEAEGVARRLLAGRLPEIEAQP